MTVWENELLKYLQYANKEFFFRRQYFFKFRMMFEYLYRMISQKRYIEKQIDFLEKLNIQSEKHNKKLTDIENRINNIAAKLKDN